MNDSSAGSRDFCHPWKQDLYDDSDSIAVQLIPNTRQSFRMLLHLRVYIDLFESADYLRQQKYGSIFIKLIRMIGWQIFKN